MRVALPVVIFLFWATPAQADRVSDLTAAVLTLPDPPAPDVAHDNVVAAIAAETADVPAELLLSMAWRESRFDPRTVGSHGAWHHDYPPRDGANACGVTQANTHGEWKTCVAFRTLALSYASTVTELEAWMSRCQHEVKRSAVPTCALAGYGGGNSGLSSPSVWRSARAALGRAARLRAQVQPTVAWAIPSERGWLRHERG